jgi:hypothetical protein
MRSRTNLPFRPEKVKVPMSRPIPHAKSSAFADYVRMPARFFF